MKRALVLLLAMAPLTWVASGQEPAATSPVHGGSVDKQAPNQVQAFLAKHCPECHGFYGASSMERLPTEIAISEQTQAFKRLGRQQEAETIDAD